MEYREIDPHTHDFTETVEVPLDLVMISTLDFEVGEIMNTTHAPGIASWSYFLLPVVKAKEPYAFLSSDLDILEFHMDMRVYKDSTSNGRTLRVLPGENCTWKTIADGDLDEKLRRIPYDDTYASVQLAGGNELFLNTTWKGVVGKFTPL